MVNNDAATHRANRLLAAITAEDFERLARHMRVVQLQDQDILAEAGEEIDHAYFPHSGLICSIAVMQESGLAETASIGAEGIVGFEGVLGSSTTTNRILVQASGTATKIPTRHVRAAMEQSSAFRAVIFRYIRALHVQLAQSVACNGLHSVEERFARWLLTAHDRARQDTFEITQELLADLLGVHRPSVTIAARTMRLAGLIRYSRGVVTVTDRRGLEDVSCECYGVVRRAFADLFPARRKV